MAATRRTTAKSGGSTLFGLLVGLVVGVAAAVGVTLYVTKAPMPFADKASREPANILLPPNVNDAPDPNQGLGGRGGSVPSAPVDTSIKPGTLPATKPPATPPTPAADPLDQLISSLGAGANTPAARAPAAPAPGTTVTPTKPAPTTAPSASAAASSTGTSAPSPPKPVTNAAQATYYLQAGAFRSEADALAMQARILLMGLPVAIEKAQVNGETIHRVRVGPFKGIDAMNASRTQLNQEKIVTSVVRP